MMKTTCLLALFLCVEFTLGHHTDNFTIQIQPSHLQQITEKDEVEVFFNVSLCPWMDTTVAITIEMENVAQVTENATWSLQCQHNTGYISGTFVVKARHIGITNLKGIMHRTFDRPIDPNHDDHDIVFIEYLVTVVREETLLITAFNYGLIARDVLMYFCFSCKWNLGNVKKIVMRPIPLAIGFVGQYILMPLIGYSLVQIFRLPFPLHFGMIAMAVSPGGVASNVNTNLLDLDLDLSMTLTFFSSVACLGMIPLWFYLLGALFPDEFVFNIPFTYLGQNLALLFVPAFFGLVLKRFLPRAARIFGLLARPLSTIMILYIIIMGSISSSYMFNVAAVVPMIFAAGILLPWIGIGLGFVLSLVFHLPKRQALTIGIETGVQNMAIAIALCYMAFPQPYADLGAVAPAIAGSFAPIPMLIAFTVVAIRNRCCPPKEMHDSESVETNGSGNEQAPKDAESEEMAPEISEKDPAIFIVDVKHVPEIVEK